MKRVFGAVLCAVLVLSFSFAGSVTVLAEELHGDYPKIANYFLKWHISETEAEALAKWDVLILDMETQITSRHALARIRALNPRIVILAYITPQEIRDDALFGESVMRKRLASRVQDEWFLKSIGGQRYSHWPGTHILNVTDDCPAVRGSTWRSTLVHFVKTEILSTGLWDGIFYDNAWVDISWLTGKNADTNADGVSEQNVDTLWRAGMSLLYKETRATAGSKIFILGNGHQDGYTAELNGKLIENFSRHSWVDIMKVYDGLGGTVSPRVNILNENTNNAGSALDTQRMRFGLGSALLLNGYYAFDFGDTAHEQLWWYDEYDVSLGVPRESASSLSGARDFSPDVWTRAFEYGLLVLNATDHDVRVPLSGEYEKIRGTVDPVINDGSIVSEVSVSSKDAVILRRLLGSVPPAFLKNGSFVRFFDVEGKRVRNGFFAFDSRFRGGVWFATHKDVTGGGAADSVSVSQGKVLVKKDNGKVSGRWYPYGAGVRNLSVAIGDVSGDGVSDIVTAPYTDMPGPVRGYNFRGNELFSFFPDSKSPRYGYTVAVCRGRSDKESEIVIGNGKGLAPFVRVYDAETKKMLADFLAYDASFRGGVSVACGNVYGDALQEIVTGPGPGMRPRVGVFSVSGEIIAPAFDAFKTIGTPGIFVSTGDIDFDGTDEIITMSDL